MARAFASASTQYLYNAAAPLTATPISMACWFYLLDVTSNNILMSLADSGADYDYFSLEARGDVAGDPLIARARYEATGAWGYIASAGAVSSGSWLHGAAVFESDNAHRTVYLNGTATAQNAVYEAPAGIDRMGIGVCYRKTLLGYTNGYIAEAAIWNVALTQADVSMLYLGLSPRLVQPANLTCYFPLIGNYSPEIDVAGGYGLTLSASAPTKADHPRVLYAVKPYVLKAVYGGGGPPAGGNQFMTGNKYW